MTRQSFWYRIKYYWQRVNVAHTISNDAHSATIADKVANKSVDKADRDHLQTNKVRSISPHTFAPRICNPFTESWC